MTQIRVTALYADNTPYGNGSITVRLVDAGAGGAVEGGVVVDRTPPMRLDKDGVRIIELVPNADVDPAGTAYAITVDRSTPTVVRYIEVPQPNGTGDDEIPYDWNDPNLQRLVTDPPVHIPAASAGDVGDVPTVVDDGNGKQYRLRPGGVAAGLPEVKLIGGYVAADAIDGSMDSFAVIVPSSSPVDVGIIPAGWSAVPGLSGDAAFMEILLGYYGDDGVDFVVWSGGSWSARHVSVDTIGSPWAEVVGAWFRWPVTGDPDGLVTVLDSDGDLTPLNAAHGEGLYAGLGTPAAVLTWHEGKHADAIRHVGTYFAGPVPDLSTLMAGPVSDDAQPIGDDGTQATRGMFVACLDPDDGLWIKFINRTTGAWSDNPSHEAATPVDASGWAGTKTTNILDSGSGFICYPSGVRGTWMGHDADGYVTGQPASAPHPCTDGEWAITVSGDGATESYVDAAIAAAVAALLDGAPGALDTLNELAAALNDDASFAASVTSALAAKAPLVSPALTGNPTAPTQSAGNNSTRLATTAYADAGDALAIPKSLVDAKGDLIVATANDTPARLAVGAAGTQPVANSNETTGIGWVSTSSLIIYESGAQVDLAPYVSTNNPLTSGRIVYYRFRVPRRITFDRFGINHISGLSTTGDIFLGIYSPTAVGGGPGSRLIDITSGGSINPTTTAGIKLISGSWTLDPGDYWYGVLGVFSGGTAPTVPMATTIGSFIFPESTGLGNQTPIQNSLSALPSSASGYIVGVSTAPVMLARPA